MQALLGAWYGGGGGGGGGRRRAPATMDCTNIIHEPFTIMVPFLLSCIALLKTEYL